MMQNLVTGSTACKRRGVDKVRRLNGRKISRLLGRLLLMLDPSHSSGRFKMWIAEL
jgi:hypothetical protein